MTRVLAFINRKGGSAKTTSAVNVAGRLAQLLEPSGQRVLLVDLDPQGHAAAALGVDTLGRCISRLLIGEASFRDTIVPADRAASGGPSRPNLFVVPATDRLKEATQELGIKDFVYYSDGRRKDEDRPTLQNILSYRFRDILHHFAYIIVDCPPSLGPLDRATYDFVEEAIVPVKMAYLDTAGARQHLDDILTAQAEGVDIRIAYVLPTFFRGSEVLARQVLQRLEQLYGQAVADPIPQSVIVEKSQAAGQKTLFEYEPDSPPAQAYDLLIQRIMRHGR